MRRLFVAAAVLVLVLAGCKKPDSDRVDESLRNSAFFRALGAVPGAKGSYTSPGGGLDGDTSLPISAARTVRDPQVGYQIHVAKPTADVDFQISWPCTLMVVYTDLPDTGIRDTVLKPAPKINGVMQWRFEFQGDSWAFTELSPCEGRFDSLLNHIAIESLQVKARRAGQTITYPTLDSVKLRLLVRPYPYTFQAGDSVDLRLWETDDREFVWTFLHCVPADFHAGFSYDTLSRSYYGSWVVNQVGTHWVWFEAVDLHDAILDKTTPDRSLLWGLPYIVED